MEEKMARGAALIGVVAALFVLQTAGASAQDKDQYRVRLAPVPMDGGMRATVAGKGSATGVLKGTTLTIEGTFEGLLSPATTARLHRGPAMGVRGPSFAELTLPAKAEKGTISGSIALAPEQVRALRAGQLYIQIASEKAPEGNLWGWFVQ
jgi:hypothetical protein